MTNSAPPSFDSRGRFVSKFPPVNFAIASFVFALFGLFGAVFSSIVAIVLGHIALQGVRKIGYTGRIFACAGLLLGYGFVAYVLLLVVGFSWSLAHPSPGG
jgi:hypothetical protein